MKSDHCQEFTDIVFSCSDSSTAAVRRAEYQSVTNHYLDFIDCHYHLCRLQTMTQSYGVQLNQHWVDKGILNLPIEQLLLSFDWTTVSLSKPHDDWKALEHELSKQPIVTMSSKCLLLESYFRNAPPANHHNTTNEWFLDNQVTLGPGGVLSLPNPPTAEPKRVDDLFLETFRVCVALLRKCAAVCCRYAMRSAAGLWRGVLQVCGASCARYVVRCAADM